MKRFKDFTLIERVVIVSIVGMIALIIIAARQMAAEKEAFMRDCMQDHKEYECTLMWKEAQPDTQTIIVPSSG